MQSVYMSEEDEETRKGEEETRMIIPLLDKGINDLSYHGAKMLARKWPWNSKVQTSTF